MSKSPLVPALVLALLAGGARPLLAQTVPAATPEEVARLVAVLKSDAPQKEKVDACRQLGVIGTRDAVPALAALLTDEKLSHMARYGLEPIPDPSVDEALRGALTKVKGRLLAGVIGSLGVRRDAAAVPALAARLTDADADVAQAAARALGRIGTPEAAKALLGALAGVPAVNQVAFSEGCLRAAEALAAQGRRDDALAAYDRLRALASPPHQVRTAALRGAILARGGKEGLALLQENLRSEEYLLFAAAVRTSAEMPGPEVTQALAAALGRLPADHQVLAIQALAKRADAAAVPALTAAGKAGAKPVRLAAIQALAATGDPAAAPTLLGWMDDADRDVAQAAQEALASLRGDQVDAAVLALLAAQDPARRVTGMALVGRRRMTAAMPTLLKAAADADAGVRAAAMRTLGDLGGPAELPALLDRLLRATDPQDLSAAEQAVAAVCSRAADPEASTAKVVGLLEKAPTAQKGALVRVLGTVGGPAALKALRAAVADPDKDVRAAAIRTLCSWKDAEVIPDLLALARNAAGPTEKTLGLRGYLGWAANTKVAAGERLAMCRQAASLITRPDEKKLLLAALGTIATPDAVAMILPYVDDAATKNEACAAVVAAAEKVLKGTGAARAAPALVEPLQKVAQAATGGDLAQRAKAALAQAQALVKPRGK